MLRLLKIFALIVLVILVAHTVWVLSSESRQNTVAQLLYDKFVTGNDSSTFIFKPNGDILVRALDCDNTGITHQHATRNIRTTKIEGVNHKTDEVEFASSQFLRINGKIYDAYVAEFQRMGIDKTHNIANDINELKFRGTDEEGRYFTDGINYYYYLDGYAGYPTFKACFPGHDRSSVPLIPRASNEVIVETEPLIFSQFQLESPEEAKFYLSQKNNIFTSTYLNSRPAYTPFAELDGKLYFKSKSGKFILVPEADPTFLSQLGETDFGTFFWRGQQYVNYEGEPLGFDLDSFK